MKRLFGLAIFVLFVSLFTAGADQLYSDKGFAIDLPEGWVISGGDSANNYQFSDPAGKAVFIIYSYKNSDFKGAKAILSSVASKLKAKGEAEAFVLTGRDAMLADYTFSDGQTQFRGYVACIDGAAPQKGRSEEPDIALLSFTQVQLFEQYNDVLLSALDSFSLTVSELLKPGPVSQYYLPLPASGEKTVKLKAGAKNISAAYDEESLDAAQTVIQREDRVLKRYASAAPELAVAAWKRFYRIAYRDSYSRLDEISFRLVRAYEETWMEAHPESLESAPPEFIAARLLEWLQSFKYIRSKDGTDFINPFSASITAEGDCDSRAMLMAIILNHFRIESIIMVSSKYAHSVAACDVKGEGARFPFEGKKWLVADTTAKVGIGLIDQTMSNISEWIGISFRGIE